MSSKAQAQRLIKSERDLGQIQTLAVSPMVDGFVDLYDGHQRCSAWLTVKEPSFEVLALQSNRPLTEDERRKVSVTLHTATGSWDWDALSSWSAADLHEWGMDKDLLKEWNNETNNLKEMLNAEQAESVDAEPQTDRAAELLEKWKVQTGDLWQIGEHRLICGDCTDAAVVARVMGGERAELCFTSPPYNGNTDLVYKKRGKEKKLYGNHYDDNLESQKYIDFVLSFIDLTHSILSDSGNLLLNISYNSNSRHEYLEIALRTIKDFSFSLMETIIWKKALAMPIPGYHFTRIIEFIFWFSKDENNLLFNKETFEPERNIWEITNQKSQSAEHAAGFPVGLPEKGIKLFCNNGAIVYEPFSGSGTTLVACQNLSRRGRAVEISPAYCAVTLERMSTAFPELEIKRLE